jgi:hypothetical protein
MIRRAPHGTPTYATDQELVFTALNAMLAGDPAQVYIRQAVATRNGRLAWDLLQTHYLSKGVIDAMTSKAEKLLDTLAYTGRDTRRNSFETFVRRHTEQHAFLADIAERTEYPGIDERTKVTRFLQGIKDPALLAAKGTIIADKDMRVNFALASAHVAAIIGLTTAEKPTLQISDVHQDGSDRVEDRYYDREEYKNLSVKQKTVLRDLREKRGKLKPKGKGHKGKFKKSGAYKKLSNQIAAVEKRYFAQLKTKKSEVESEEEAAEDDTIEEAPKGSNRSNPALSRGKARK